MKLKIAIFTICIFLSGTIFPTGIWGQSANAKNYQELIRKNFQLRKGLKALESKYAELEDERKVLILHVKELQAVKDSRSEAIQSLKNMVASLRIEMLKDPKLTKIIDSLNQKVEEAESQKNQFQEKVSQLESEKLELDQEIKKMEVLVNSQKKQDGKADAQLTKVKDEISVSQQRIGNLESDKKELEKKVEQMKALVSSQREKDGKAEDRLAIVQEKISTSRERIRTLESDKKELEQKVKKMKVLSGSEKKRDGKTNAQLAELKRDRDLSQVKIERLKAERNELVKKVKMMESTFLVDKNLAEVTKNKLSKELAKAHKNLDKQNSELKVALERVKKEKENLLEKNERLKKDLKMASVSLEASELETVRQSLLQMEQAVKYTKRKKEENARLVKDIQRLDSERGKFIEKIRMMELSFNVDKDLFEVTQNKLSKELAKARKNLDKQNSGLKIALERIKKEKENLLEKNEGLKKSLEVASVSLEVSEKALHDELKKVQSLEKSFKGKTQGLKEELETVRRSLLQADEAAKNVKKEKGENDQLAKDIKRLNKEKSEFVRKFKRLEENFQKAGGKNKKLGQKIMELTQQVRQGDKVKQQLMNDLKEEQKVLASTNKDLKKERLRNKFEREHYEEQLKFAKADRAMFEAKIQDLEQRTLVAETRRSKVEGELKREMDKAFLKESEVIALQEERSKLEKKLLKYIEQKVDSQNENKSGRLPKRSTKGHPLKTKKEIAQQKLKMHYNMAIAYDQLKMYREEEKEYMQCLKINSKDANVHYNLAILYDDKLNKNKKAVEHYRKYLALKPVGEEMTQVKEWMLHAEQQHRLDNMSQ